DIELVFYGGDEIHHRQAVELQIAGEGRRVGDLGVLLVERLDQRADAAVHLFTVHRNVHLLGLACGLPPDYGGKAAPEAACQAWRLVDRPVILPACPPVPWRRWGEWAGLADALRPESHSRHVLLG